jgi:hypothetical protein
MYIDNQAIIYTLAKNTDRSELARQETEIVLNLELNNTTTTII